MAQANVTIVCGSARSGKTDALLQRYRETLIGGAPGVGMWLAPTGRSAAEIRSRLVDDGLSACLRPQILTFERLAREVLSASNTRVQLIAGSHRRQLIRQLIREAAHNNRLRHFAAIADTAGLISQIEGFITELKRLEIWPEELRASCEQRGISAKDREFLTLYEAYQNALLKHDLFDAEGCSWAARANLKDGQIAPYESLKLVVVDGFNDFTRTQHDILEILASRVDQLTISLPLETPSRRPELFEKSRQTLVDLQQRHAGCKTINQTEDSKTAKGQTEERQAGRAETAMGALAQSLFVSAVDRQPLANLRGIEVIAATQQIGEIREVARRVKQLLTDGDPSRPGQPIRAAEIAVVFRSLPDAAPLVREVFAEYGVPITLEAQEPLGRAPLLTSLVSLLRLVQEDWPYRRLLAVVTHNGLRPPFDEIAVDEIESDEIPFDEKAAELPSVQAAEQVIRRLQIPNGREELLRAVTRLCDRVPREGNADRKRRDEKFRSQAARALPLLKKLSDSLEQLPNQASLEEWANALDRLLRQLGFLSDDRGAFANADRAAAKKLADALAMSHQLLMKFSDGARPYDLGEMLGVLDDIMECELLPGDEDPVGRVRILSAPGTRTLSIPYLFLAGLAEQAFPPPLDVARLYSDAETSRLIASGLPLPSRQQRGHEEMLLFYEVVTRATRRLTFSYPATDSKGEPLLPSPYLDEVIRICGSEKLGLKSVANLRPLPEIDRPRSTMELRIQAVEEAISGNTNLLATVVTSDGSGSGPSTATSTATGTATGTGARNLLPAIATVQSRSERDYGPYEGVLSSAAVQARLHERFGELRAWSPSHLEQYAACPHQFYLEQVLGLEPLADLALDDDHMMRGSLLHHTLAAVHRALNELQGYPSSPTDTDADTFVQQFDNVLSELLETWGSPGAVERALREIDRRTLLDWAERYLLQHAKYDDQFKNLDQQPRPELFEISFGLSQDEDADSHSTRDPLVLKQGAEEVHIAGRVDRVDVGSCDGVSVFNVIDYKSGSKVNDKLAQIEAGLALQLPLYAMAVQELGLVAEGAVPWQAGYWRVKKEGFPARNPLQFFEAGNDKPRPTEQWQQLQSIVVARVVSLVRGIRQAEFPMHSANDDCTNFCDFSKVCRVNQTRSLDKQWSTPGDPSSKDDNRVADNRAAEEETT